MFKQIAGWTALVILAPSLLLYIGVALLAVAGPWILLARHLGAPI